MFPAPTAERPRHGERKKFCMSIMTRAVKAGEMITEVVVVDKRMDCSGDGIGNSGGDGLVRSKTDGEAL